jgi:hypothetical protein
LGIPDTFKLSLTIGGLTKSYLSSDTGESAGGFNLNVAKINLDDFGIPVGGTLDKIVIGLDTESGQGAKPSLSLVGAINSQNLTAIPEPASTLGLLTLGFLGTASAINRKLSQGKK